MAKYRKKPVEIEAVEFSGQNFDDVIAFTNGQAQYDPEEINPGLLIHTLEGVMRVNAGDFVIKGVQGEFYPCKPDIFEQTYDAVGD